MKRTAPTISVIMSVYNTEEIFLREAIESVLSQTYKDFEFIIIDDYSDEITKTILDSYTVDNRVIIIRNTSNLGLTKSLNKGISFAKGKYIARMDSDDVCMLNRFEREVDFLEGHHEVGVVGSYFKVLEDGLEYDRGNEAHYPAQIKARLFFCNSGIMHSSVMMRASLINAESGILYDENIKKSQDYDLWVRISRKTEIYVIPEYLMKYRVFAGQISNVNRTEQTKFRQDIILRQLNELNIVVDCNLEKLHLGMCSGEKVKSLKELKGWVKELKEKNSNIGLFNIVAFKYYLAFFSLRSALKTRCGLYDLGYVLYFGGIFCLAYVHFLCSNMWYNRLWK